MPVATDIKKHFPDIEIDFLCGPVWKDLVLADESISDVITWKKNTPTDDLIKTLKAKEYDAALVMYSRPAALVNALVEAKIPIRVGSGRRFRGFFKFTHRTFISRRRGGKHECTYNRIIGQRFIKILNNKINVLNDAAKWNMKFSDEDHEWVNQYLKKINVDKPFIVIQAGSDDSSPNWPIDYIGELIDRLAEEKIPSLVHIGPNEDHLLEKLNGLCKSKVLAIQNASLTELGAFLEKASLIVSPSTGPLHIAAAVNTPIVGIYPPVLRLLPQRWGPLSDRYKVFMPSLPNGKPYRKRYMVSDDCMYEVSVDEVYQAVKELYSS